MLTNHGALGPLCVLNVWAYLMENDGVFDSSKPFNLKSLAIRCACDPHLIQPILDSAVECGFLTVREHAVNGSLYTKQRIVDTIAFIEKQSNQRSLAGNESARKRSVNGSSTDRQIDKTDTEPIGSAIAIGTGTTALAPFGVRLVEKFKIKTSQRQISKCTEVFERIRPDQQKLIRAALNRLFGGGKAFNEDDTETDNSTQQEWLHENPSDFVEQIIFEKTGLQPLPSGKQKTNP